MNPIALNAGLPIVWSIWDRHLAAKLALRIRKDGRKPYLIAADVYRPAAVDQIKTLAKQLGVSIYEEGTSATPPDIVERGYAATSEAGNERSEPRQSDGCNAFWTAVQRHGFRWWHRLRIGWWNRRGHGSWSWRGPGRPKYRSSKARMRPRPARAARGFGGAC